MPIFSNDELLQLNKAGWIPGPYEEEEAFAERVQYGLHLAENLPEELRAILGSTLPMNREEIVAPSLNKLTRAYDCAPDWVPLFFSNDKLPFWHGGCAWIFQMTEDSPTSALIQLRKGFYRSQRYLAFYEREELLTHELVHVGRMMFQEPKFEELLAYRTSRSPFRRWWGSIVQSSGESALFLLTLFVLVVFDLFLLASGRPDVYSYALWLKMIPLLMLVAAGVRLWQRHRTFAQCLVHLYQGRHQTSNLDQAGQSPIEALRSERGSPSYIGKGDEEDQLNKVAAGLNSTFDSGRGIQQCNAEYAEAIAYRLTDEEIFLFAKFSPREIKDYATRQAEKELRWRVIVQAYFL